MATEPAPATQPPPAPKRLTRRRDGKIAGVASGIADYFNVDPTLIRLGFVVSIFFGGVGVIAYLIAWLVLPVDDGTEPPTTPRSGITDSTTRTVLAIGLLIAAVAIALAAFDKPFGGGVIIPVALIIGGIVLLAQRPDEGAGSPSVPPAPPTGESATASTALAPQPPPPPGTSAATTTLPPPPQVPVSRPPEPPSLITPIVLSVLALVAAGGLALRATGWVDVSVTQILAAGLVVVGAGAIVSAFIGRARGLVILGVFLTAAVLSAAAVEPAFEDGVGERTYVPSTVDELRPLYDLGMGRLELDLTELDFEGGDQTVRVDLGIGQAVVVVPAALDIVVIGNVDVGQLEVFGRDVSGFDNELQVGAASDEEGQLTIELDVGIGEGEVRVG